VETSVGHITQVANNQAASQCRLAYLQLSPICILHGSVKHSLVSWDQRLPHLSTFRTVLLMYSTLEMPPQHGGKGDVPQPRDQSSNWRSENKKTATGFLRMIGAKFIFAREAMAPFALKSLEFRPVAQRELFMGSSKIRLFLTASSPSRRRSERAATCAGLRMQ